MSPLGKRVSFAALSLAMAMGIAAGGCKKDDKEPETNAASPASGGASASVGQLRTELSRGQRQVDETVAALASLPVQQANLTPALQAMDKEIAETEAQAQVIRDRVRDMQARAATYRVNWEGDTSNITDPELKAAAAQRSAMIQERFDALSKQMLEARDAYQPFIKDLKEVQTYLRNDPTPTAVTGAQNILNRASENGKALSTKLGALVNEVNAMSSQLAPAGTPG